MKIAFIGTRGIPASHGGFETMVEEISTRISKDYEVFVSSDCQSNFQKDFYKNIKIYKSPYSKPKNPINYYLDSLIKAKKWGADHILMCGVGGSICVLLNMDIRHKIYVNPDGLGFKRSKYNFILKSIFFTQYFLSAIIFKHIVCDSKEIQKFYLKNFFVNKKRTVVIEYGANLNKFIDTKSDIELDKINPKINYRLLHKSFFLVVARLEPENNIEMIIKGYKIKKRRYPLVIIGNLNTKHSKKIIKYKSDDVIFLGGVYIQENLQLLRSNCLAYMHGHSVGGTNPSLLEAMASKNLCVCHDNVFNREILSNSGLFFKNYIDVGEIIERIENHTNFDKIVEKSFEKAINYYNWDKITEKYLNLFQQK